MSDIWKQARQAAMALRYQLLGEAADTAPADTLIKAALREANLSIYLLEPTDSLLAGAHAVLVRDLDAIWVRRDLLPAHRFLLIAHELAHYYLHPEYITSDEYEGGINEEEGGNTNFLVGYGPRERRETEANVFARELALPSHVARRRFYEQGQLASEIATDFGVTQSIVIKQLQNLPVLASRSEETNPPEALPLDESQQAAAEIQQGPLLVGAGPGTGKTRTLVARVKYLIENGVAPENILCLTFSRKATAELRERVGRHLPTALARRVAICTFHAFGLDLLRRYHRFAELPTHPVLISQAEAFALMENRIAADVGDTLWFPHEPTYPLRDCLSVIGRLKEEMVTPAEVMAKAVATRNEKQRAVAAIYARYEATLREKQALDSADLVCRAVSLLAENESVRDREQTKWQHILVDEYQDVNRAGAKLVQLLGGNGAGVWCVGDLRQAIYRFRGASPANVTRFAEDFPGGIRKDLAVNYRSRKPLVSCFGQVVAKNALLWQAHRATSSDESCITLAIAEDEVAQISGICQSILSFRKSQPEYKWQDFAVLCRTNPQAKAIRTVLEAKGIPVSYTPDGLVWLRDKDVRELLLLLSLTYETDLSLATRTGRTLPDYLSTKKTPADFLSAALYGELGLARQMGHNNAVQTLLSLAQSFAEQSNILLTPDENRNKAFLRHVRRVARLNRESKRDEETNSLENQDVVQVQTIHAAKGLEFPVVFVPNLSQGRFPPQARPAVVDTADTEALLGVDSSDADEEARLLFVAMTRARDFLFFTLAEKYEGRMAQPSVLLAPLEEIPEITRVRWKAKTESQKASSKSASLPTEETSGLPVPDPASMDASESTRPTPAHELERYLRCPRRYYYETRCGYGDTRERTPYDALKKATRSVLQGKKSETAFEAVWDEYTLSGDDPWLTAYRKEWQTVLTNAQSVRELAPALPYQFKLAEGMVEVQPDGVAPDGTVERFTFAKSKETGRQDAVNTLLFTAAPEGTPVRVRHVRTGEERTIEPAKHASTRRARESHLLHYDRALRGIRLNMFPAEPEDASDCVDCAYLLVCDQEKL